jgi:hypothetical protein
MNKIQIKSSLEKSLFLNGLEDVVGGYRGYARAQWLLNTPELQ